MTPDGGGQRAGNIFSVGVDGSNYYDILSFNPPIDGIPPIGWYPKGSLTLNGTMLFGMTDIGGYHSAGNVFSVDINGQNYKDLVSFTGGPADGNGPWGNLTLGDTTLYGLTTGGGTHYDGTLFSVGADGTNYQSLLSFTGTGGSASGNQPFGSLTLGGTTLYGMTESGGAGGCGNIFSVGTNGTSYKNLVSFTGSSGTATGLVPNGSLTLSGSTLYGMTAGGGANGDGNIFSVGTDGTSYKNLVSFTGSGGAAKGNSPEGSLLLSGTTFYGMTYIGGAHNEGTVFSVGMDGSDYEDLYDFTGLGDGGNPQGSLIISGNTLYGMALSGGSNRLGTVFSLTVPEPRALALFSVAGAAVVSYRWRRRGREADGR